LNAPLNDKANKKSLTLIWLDGDDPKNEATEMVQSHLTTNSQFSVEKTEE